MNSDFSFKTIIRLALPAIFSQAAIVLVALLDQLFVGPFGPISIAAVSISNNIVLATYNLFEGIRTGTNVLTAKYLGAKDEESVSKILKLSFILALILGFAVLTLALFVRFNPFGDLFDLMGNNQTKLVGPNFLLITSAAAPFVLIFLATTGFFTGLKDSLTPFYLTLMIICFDLILDYAFVYGVFGYLKMGLWGAAVSTFFTYIFGAICCFVFLLKKRESKKFINFKFAVSSIKREYFKLFIEIGLYAGLLVSAFLIFLRLFKHIDPISFAAFHIVFTVFIIINLPSMGFLVAGASIVGKLVGEKRQYLIISATRRIVLVALIFDSLLSIVLLVFPGLIAGFFSPNDPAVQVIVSKLLWIVAITNIFGTVYLVLRGVLIGIHDTRFIVIEGLFSSYCIFLPFAYLLGIKLGYGILGGYIAYFIWTATDCFLFLWRFFSNEKARKFGG